MRHFGQNNRPKGQNTSNVTDVHKPEGSVALSVSDTATASVPPRIDLGKAARESHEFRYTPLIRVVVGRQATRPVEHSLQKSGSTYVESPERNGFS
jgi:hypothetical protein